MYAWVWLARLVYAFALRARLNSVCLHCSPNMRSYMFAAHLHLCLAGLACVHLARYTNASSCFRSPIHRAELHVRRSRLHVRLGLAGKACVRITRYTRASICFRLLFHRAVLHVRCSWLHERLVGLACVRLARYTHASICFLFAHPSCWATSAPLKATCTLGLGWLGLSTHYTLHAGLNLLPFPYSPC